MADVPRRENRELQTTEHSAPAVSIIIPTYCEAENLAELVERIDAATSQISPGIEIIVVDDNSPDNTCEICAQLAARFPLKLIVRTSERGLSSAVIKGLSSARGSVLVVMDADLSHPPEAIPLLVSEIRDRGMLFAIGSRYIEGGGAEEQWGWGRRLISRTATLLARPLTSVHDPMSGFFALSRESFQSVAETLNPVGFKIGLELMVKLGCRETAEVPIYFCERRYGQSKLNFVEQLKYLAHLARLYMFKWPC